MGGVGNERVLKEKLRRENVPNLDPDRDGVGVAGELCVSKGGEQVVSTIRRRRGLERKDKEKEKEKRKEIEN